MVAGSLAPQAAHRRPGISRRLVLVFIVHIAHAFRLGSGALILRALIFLIKRLAASLARGCSLGGLIQLWCYGSLVDRFIGSVRSGNIDKAALLLELLGHATHLPSSAIPR